MLVQDGQYRIRTHRWPQSYIYMQCWWKGNIRGWGGDPGPEGWWRVKQHPKDQNYFLLAPKKYPECFMYVQMGMYGNCRGWDDGDPGEQGYFKITPHPSEQGFFLISTKAWEDDFLYMQVGIEGNVRTWYGDPGPQGWWKLECWNLDLPTDSMSAGVPHIVVVNGGGGAADLQQLGEVILEVEHALGVDVKTMPASMRSIAFPIESGRGRLSAAVGRSHQYEFFERFIPDKNLLSAISRAHFELTWEPPAIAPILRKLSTNMLHVDDRPVGTNEPVVVTDGTRLSFMCLEGSGTQFLVMRVTLRSRLVVATEGLHPAAMERPGTLQSHRTSGLQPAIGPQLHAEKLVSVSPPYSGAPAVLECIYAVGVSDLTRLPVQTRAMPLCLDEDMEIGRHHQTALFEGLLGLESRWLGLVSRSHCRVRLTCSGGQVCMSVDNLSSNAILVGGKPLNKGCRDMIQEGGVLAFIAEAPGGVRETQFLQFMLRRAR